MKVLKKGRAEEVWSKRFTCTGKGNGEDGCGARLMVEKDDLFHHVTSDYSGDSYHDVAFRCIECKAVTNVTDEDDVPFLPYDLPRRPRNTGAKKRGSHGQNRARE